MHHRQQSRGVGSDILKIPVIQMNKAGSVTAERRTKTLQMRTAEFWGAAWEGAGGGPGTHLLQRLLKYTQESVDCFLRVRSSPSRGTLCLGRRYKAVLHAPHSGEGRTSQEKCLGLIHYVSVKEKTRAWLYPFFTYMWAQHFFQDG